MVQTSFSFYSIAVSQSVFLFLANAQRLWLHTLLFAASFHRTKEQIDEELQIIQKAQKNPRYFAPIYERYYDSIFIFINKRVDNEEVTAEITSFVFYKALQNLSKFKGQGVPFSAWLFRVALNEVNQYFRKQKKAQRSVSINDYHINILFEEMEDFDPQEDPHQLVTKLLENLSPDDVQFLELRFFENRSFKEIGFMLDMTEANAKVKTYRILKKLKKIAG